MKKILLFVMILLFFVNVNAQETLPPYHWANDYIDYLKVSGYLPELQYINRPFDRIELAKLILEIDDAGIRIKPKNKKIIRILLDEFKPELEYLSNLDDTKWERLIKKAADYFGKTTENESSGLFLKAGVFGDVSDKYNSSTDQGITHLNLHSQFGAFIENNLALYNNMQVLNEPDADYIGKEFSGLYAYAEQAYLAYKSEWISAKIGRDFFQLGPGQTGQLLFSDNSRPFDMYSVNIGSKNIQFSFWGIMLDRRQIVDSTLTQYARYANRYINGHRLSLNLSNKYFFAVNEVVLYGGPKADWDLGYINPVAAYYDQNVNDPTSTANIFYSLEWDIYYQTLEFYGEFLIDDIQVEKEGSGDLEPNELGLLTGLKWARPFYLNGVITSIEYTQVRNRTYNVQVNDWEKYLHRNKVIGHYLGNNFESYYMDTNYWILPELKVGLSTNYIRQGEGSVAGEFNTDYKNYTVEEGYDESFPFGTIEKSWQSGISILYRPHRIGCINLDILYNDYKNYKNLSEMKHSEWIINAGVWLEWSSLF